MCKKLMVVGQDTEAPVLVLVHTWGKGSTPGLLQLSTLEGCWQISEVRGCTKDQVAQQSNLPNLQISF